MKISDKSLRKMIREAWRDMRSRQQMFQDLGDPPGPPRPRMIPEDEDTPDIPQLGAMIRKNPIVMKDASSFLSFKQLDSVKRKLDKGLEDARKALEMDLADPYTLNRIEKGAEGLSLISAIALKDLDQMPDVLQKMGILKLFEVRDELESVLAVLREQGRGDNLAVYLQELDSAAYNMMDLIRGIADSIDPSEIPQDLYLELQSVEEGSWWSLR